MTPNVTYPNAYPKQLAAVRRRAGLTTAEYLYHHTIVHGRKAWNAPDSIDQPLAYIQDHIFDSAYGINTTANPPTPNYFGHNDMTELYSRSENAFATPPPNNYTATVIGPDGNAFSDFSSAISMYAYETFPNINSTCRHPRAAGQTVFNAFYWVFASAPNANTLSFSNTTFATTIMSTLLSSFASNTIYNASIHTSVPGLDSRPYYGGYNNPTLNAVLKFWLCDDNEAVSAFRMAQTDLVAKNGDLGIGLDESFVVFTREVVVYDRSIGEGFSTERGVKAIEADRWRGNVVLTGPEEDQGGYLVYCAFESPSWC
ncbi:hypothetical protein T440DRAFT_552227 [Plenodomus tracheiphilus IPT5]|uniref:Uncharacterized protein n=1 Tax=Plenodomus tracheiphilus IPT5 TaxID=1408161 RepID=A0A6A7BI22_9PLEO|nr:hypothetical protein T440DRAFT_552227 [Plenodomus tracheiphilus IPT5]